MDGLSMIDQGTRSLSNIVANRIITRRVNSLKKLIDMKYLFPSTTINLSTRYSVNVIDFMYLIFKRS